MKTRFILFRRGSVYYAEDTTTGKQTSLRTKDEAEALTLLHSKNEAYRQPVLNLQIARTYLTATDPDIARRTWQVPMDEMTKAKIGLNEVAVHRQRTAGGTGCSRPRGIRRGAQSRGAEEAATDQIFTEGNKANEDGRTDLRRCK